MRPAQAASALLLILGLSACCPGVSAVAAAAPITPEAAGRLASQFLEEQQVNTNDLCTSVNCDSSASVTLQPAFLAAGTAAACQMLPCKALNEHSAHELEAVRRRMRSWRPWSRPGGPQPRPNLRVPPRERRAPRRRPPACRRHPTAATAFAMPARPAPRVRRTAHRWEAMHPYRSARVQTGECRTGGSHRQGASSRCRPHVVLLSIRPLRARRTHCRPEESGPRSSCYSS